LVRQNKTPRSDHSAPATANRHRLRAACLLVPALLLTACSTVKNVKTAVFGGDTGATGPKILTGFIGGAAADEPRAALAARDVLATGGNAADAAVAAGFMLSVTLPSRASLGGAGACLAYTPGQAAPEAIMFTPAAGDAGGDRPAAVPMMARGLYLLSVRYGSRSFQSLVQPAETAAREGVPASRALVQDLDEVAAPLSQDPAAAAVFTPEGVPLVEGQNLVQPDLGALLGQIRKTGVGAFYEGTLAANLIAAIQTAGGGNFTIETMRAALPRMAAPITLQQGDNTVAFLPAPADGGLAAAAASIVLQSDPSAYAAAKARALAAAAAWRATGGDATILMTNPPPAPALAALPASTSLVVVDGKGGAVGCAFTMNNLFGTGRIAPGTGIVLGASPLNKPSPLLAAAIAWSPRLEAFRAVAAGTGQTGAPVAVASAINSALAGSKNLAIPEPGRINVAACDQYMPGNSASCHFATDPRGAGLATASD